MTVPSASKHLPARIPVLIVGGGPVGLTLAALLGRYGVSNLVIEADSGYCSGSRAICVSRRSQEILGWVGADRPLVAKGLSWVGGRSYFRDKEVLHFQMPHEPTQRFAPMVNIQQYYVEEFAHQAAERQESFAGVHWESKVTAIKSLPGGAEVEVQTPHGSKVVQADWVIACDGGRSTVRETLGLQFEGTQYEGRYVIVDVVQKTSRPVERLAWFDPPSNPGSTILMHRQPDDVWRIDYQIRDDEDPLEAVKPENVLPRVKRHLEMIGESEPWEHLWISIYNAKCLTLPRYRHDRVLLAGDAAHLVPIFGVRGLNSGIDDAGNLAWKLASVVNGGAPEALIDSYSIERVHAARENIAYGAKSTEFMAPPHDGFKLMREAALRLSTEQSAASRLVNPRQSAPVKYLGTPLMSASSTAGNSEQYLGCPAPEAALVCFDGAKAHLTSLFGAGFVLLHYTEGGRPLKEVAALTRPGAGGGMPVAIVGVSSSKSTDPSIYFDAEGQFQERFQASDGSVFLVRPDGYVAGCWSSYSGTDVRAALSACGHAL